MFEVVGQIRH